MEWPIRLGAAAVSLFALCAAPLAQMATGKVLLAVVVDRAGQPIVDLDADDFVVTEGTENREVLDVHVGDYPLALVLDDSGDPSTASAVRAAATRFIRRVGERPILITTLSSATAVAASFDDERTTVLDKLSTLALSDATPAPLLPVVANAARQVRATEAPFAGMVVIARSANDTRDPASAELLPFIVETQAPVHVVSLQASGAPPGAELLRVLAEQTRGQYTPVFSPASFEVALDRLADRLSSEMMVGYLVPPDGRGGDVRVGVRRPGARVLGLGVSR